MSEKTFRIILALVIVIWGIFVLLPSLADFLPRAWAATQLLIPGDRPKVIVTVKDRRSGDPIAEARVEIVTADGTLIAVTDKTGQAVFDAVPAGRAQRLTAQKLDYEMAELSQPAIAHRRRVRYTLAMNSDMGRRLYIGHELTAGTIGISVLDLASRLPMTAPGNANAWENLAVVDMKANNFGQRLYVLTTERLIVLSLYDGSVIKELPLQAPAGGLAIDANSEAAYVFAAGQGGRGRWLTAYYTRTWSERYSLQVSTNANRAIVLASPDGSRVYVAPVGDQTVSVYDARVARRLAAYPLGDAIKDAALSSDGRWLYLLTERQQSPLAIDTTATGAAVPVLTRVAENTLTGVTRMVYAEYQTGKWLCLLQPSAQRVSIIDLNAKSVRAVTVGKEPAALAPVPTYDYLYVANKGSNSLSINSLSGNEDSLVDSLDVRSKPSVLVLP